ncbi:DUF262 domain-containing protein [Nitrospina watsonii]|uniref:GmrSD restriction endonucleases N-terminal domain-containing protein n=1 Tax=Nitrospina watsonii TaxID=1323948 RepID=A0ABM9HH72_9BACT|nr:DUF262 domain-containing protein [Nitrospina watsonii]CAI2719370.1 conserved protein of unknown function [Nitrospina watsonii]
MEARNRNLADWYVKIKNGEIKLPRFQRFEAWDRHRISSLIETVIHKQPLGITLVLEVGEKEKFISRYLETTEPSNYFRVHEHLLDGQQRLTALWRALHNNYEFETYFIYVKAFDQYEGDKDLEDMTVFFRGRYYKKNGQKYPIWCETPSQCLKRGFIPTHLLRPENIDGEIDNWIDQATEDLKSEDDIQKVKEYLQFTKSVSDKIKDLRAIISNYNLPYLSLPSHTNKAVALDVFIKMNTNSKPLSQYDIIVAEVESVMEMSLHDLEKSMDGKYPNIGEYADLSDIVLTTSALLQDALPNQRGAWDMDKKVMVEKWEMLGGGLKRMADFLRNEGVYDRDRLPTNAVLAVIAALYTHIPESGDKRGKDELLLKKYLWYSFFTDRYENSAATHAYSDYIALKQLVTLSNSSENKNYDETAVPIFKEYDLVDEEELITAEWPKRTTIRGRGVLAVVCRLGAHDFSTSEPLNSNNIEQRHYHHVYPDALLKEAGINGFLALNCALISDKTNMSIGRKDPLKYLKDRYQWTSEEVVKDRLQSHLIPIPELANGGYEGLNETEKVEKIKKDFSNFLHRRAQLVREAVSLLAEGRQISASMLFKS